MLPPARRRKPAPFNAMRLAIVMPVLNEAGALRTHLTEALAAADETWVVDGGSRDDSLGIAEELGAHTATAPAGRGSQLRHGAELALHAGAEALVFLHADTSLPPHARNDIESALRGGAKGGGFCVRFDDPRAVFRIGERIVNLRTRLLSAPLGDQAQFVAAAAYVEIGGMREWPILEDIDFVRRLRRHGRVQVLAGPVVTAARRFQERGIVRTIARNWLIWLLYLGGVPPHRLATLYPRRD